MVEGTRGRMGEEKRMKVLELFAGTRSIGRAFEARGHDVYSIDYDPQFEDIDWCVDIGTVTARDIVDRFGVPDVVWASPDCTTFSVAAISHHRRRDPDTGYLLPVSEYAERCDAIDRHVMEMISELSEMNPSLVWFVENPRGGMRRTEWMQPYPRYTITYCQYGDTRMKPTDVWTNHPDPRFKAPCKNGDPCHDRAPRGSRSGTQGLKDHVERSRIPPRFCEHIADICEKEMGKEEDRI